MSGIDQSPTEPIRVLLVEDDPREALRMRGFLAHSPESGFEVTEARSVEPALRMLLDGDFDVVLLDLSLEEGEGLPPMARARVAASSVPIVVMGAHDDQLATRALRFGAQDYLVKGESDARLVCRTLRHAVERHGILTDLALTRQREHYLATHDALTALPNRLEFLDQLRRAVAYAARNERQLAVLFLDIDRFKGINDTLGHPVGDELLKIVGGRIEAQLRESDLVARFGGDEFLVLLQDVHHDFDPARVASRITQALAQACVLGESEYRISASVGIALFPRDGADVDLLIRNADTAMYHAKATRSQYSYYTEGMNEIVAQRLDLEHGLREAIERGSFRLDYQPQIDVARECVVGAEALVRWVDPKRGVIAPLSFVPIAEETGMISTIGKWVMRRACEDAAIWQRGGAKDVRVAVNVSSQQLLDREFPDFVARTLREAGLPPTLLDIEITESAALQERGTTLASLRMLRELGPRITIDDFGTGYSALTALKHLPVDCLKIDRSFVRDILDDPATATIATGLVMMAHGLGLETVAEGIETPEQLQFLADHGCEVMQGFLFGKPAPSAEFQEQLAAGAQWRDAIRHLR